MSCGTEKLEWLGYPLVKKIEYIFILFDRMYVRTWQTHTDRRTSHDGMFYSNALYVRFLLACVTVSKIWWIDDDDDDDDDDEKLS